MAGVNHSSEMDSTVPPRGEDMRSGRRLEILKRYLYESPHFSPYINNTYSIRTQTLGFES
jgi:hypothetical protein